MQRFTEDALRIMRAIRLSAQLGYEIEPETLRAASALAPNLRRISSERIREELEKTLLSDRPDLLRTAWAAGITKEFIPEFDRCMETDQINPHHCYTVGEHILKGVSLVRKDRISHCGRGGDRSFPRTRGSGLQSGEDHPAAAQI